MAKVLLVLLVSAAAAVALDDGQYRPGKYGDDGRYRQAQEGQYFRQGTEGIYNGIYDGRYNGQYGANNPFANFGALAGQNGFYDPRFANQYVSGVNAPSPGFYQPTFDGTLGYFTDGITIPSASDDRFAFSKPAAKPVVPPAPLTVPNAALPAPPLPPKIPVVQQNPSLYAKSAYANNYASAYNNYFRILKQDTEVGPEGYHYLYETENQIKAEESGHLQRSAVSKEDAISANGFFEYIGDDGLKYRVDYLADENGFQPTGAHLPVPPPIPEAIAKSLNYLRSVGKA